MKHTIIPVEGLLGIDTIEPQDIHVASDITNMVREPDGSWTTRIGYEKYFTSEPGYGPWNNAHRISSMFYWRRASLGNAYIIYTLQDEIRTVYNNPPTEITLYSGITPASDIEPGPSYAVLGDNLIIVDGHGPALVYDGQYVRQLGWHVAPEPPTVFGSHPGVYAPPVPAAVPPDGFTRFAVPDDAPVVGLGDIQANFRSKFRYAVSFVSESGCESPVSAALSDVVSWQVAAEPSRYAVAVRIGTGPEGTIARKIYRTSNIAQTFDQNTLYLVGIVKDNITDLFVDTKSDYELNQTADRSRVLNPFRKPKIVAVYNSRLWVVDAEQPTTLFYSKPYRFEEFTIDNIVTTNSNQGGAIRALVPWQEYLIVLRDNAIDIIVTSDGSEYLSVPVTAGIGDVGANTAQIVPGQGVVFLTTTGIYQLTKHDDTDRLVVKNLSRSVPDTLRRLNAGRIATATSVVSPKWGEYHVYFDADADERVGLVLNFFGKPAWSVREGFPVGPMICDTAGEVIFAHNTGSFVDRVLVLGESGLFVLSRIHTLGYNTLLNKEQVPYTEPGDPVFSRYVSSWHYAGDRHINKAFRHVYLYLKSTGNQPLTIQTAVDGHREYDSNTASVAQLVTGDEQPVWQTSEFGQVTWQGDELCEIRFDINAVGARFRFKIDTMNDLALVGYAVAYTELPGQIMPGRKV